MATIKVTYNSISRRFNVNSANWAELESKLRSLYNIPITSSLVVSYNDEDGDVITISSDLELKDVLAQQSSGRPIKLVLNTVNNKSENVGFEDDDDKFLNVEAEDFSTPQQNQQQTIEREEENVESSRPSSYYQHVSINDEEEEPEYDQSTPLLNKEKEKESEKQHFDEGIKENPEKKKQQNEDDEEDDDEIIFIILQPWARHAFFGPRFGFFGGPRFGLFDGNFGLFGGPRHCPFSPLNSYGRPQCHRPAFFNGYCGPSAYNFGSRQCGSNAFSQACNRNSKPSCCSKPQRKEFCNKNSEASTSASAKNNRCDRNNYNYNSSPSCGRNFNFFHPCRYNQTPLTQEQLNDKLSTLHSMGFDSSNNALYEDLLKRYNGNIERVIELLLRNQQVNEHYEKVSTSEFKKQNEIVINEGKSNNDEVKQVNNEKTKPYNL
ncbi:hypothetical protein C1645_780300 [Glomus cerebriforme]|uniref:UBA domain-containing protein n=1 Tax=Glomus cerebriforme TaxID=658196 RepID=A0A397SJ37_9GLOM|nr:hypothetical protein C1645_780300 [Glomus cerebriforme]